MSESLLVSVHEGLARVTFNRPASGNAMDFEMARRWRDAAQTLTNDPSVGAVILDAVGPIFCAGGDVAAMSAEVSGADLTAMAHVINEGIRMFTETPVPIVAAVQGTVAGGGLGLMLTADYIVAAEPARFVSKYADIGLTPDLGATTLLPAAIGQRRTLELFLQDRTLSAHEAREWGLVAEVVPADGLATRAEEVARYWLSGATSAFGHAKRLVRVGADRSFAENLRDEAETIGAALDTPQAKARVAAFVAASAKASRKETP